MNTRLLFYSLAIILFSIWSCNSEQESSFDNGEAMKVRIAKIEVDAAYLEEYVRILKEEAATSVLKEPGVLCIYPMFKKEDPNSILLLEIYASEEAYQAHLKSPHFLHYKSATLHMVTSLELVDMEAIDKEMMNEIFKKIK